MKSNFHSALTCALFALGFLVLGIVTSAMGFRRFDGVQVLIGLTSLIAAAICSIFGITFYTMRHPPP